MNRGEYRKVWEEQSGMRARVKADPNRLRYHLMPPTGWMNDPNGLCEKDGVVHVYFQYTPFQVEWGKKLWGHYTTQDWLTFREEPPALFPDCPWDRDGVYSGSTLVEGGQIHTFYTGNVKWPGEGYDYIHQGREQNTIYAVSGDGERFQHKERLMANGDYPADLTCHVRDPKVWKEEDGYHMVLGGRDQQDRGCVLHYRSQDLHHWSLEGRWEARDALGYMWECPDCFSLEGNQVLLFCPQGMTREPYRFQNENSCVWTKVQSHGSISAREVQELDVGFEFYAPHTFRDSRGRRILLAWMGLPDTPHWGHPTRDYQWIHCLTLPRELVWEHGRLYQRPLEELRRLRGPVRQSTTQSFGMWHPKHCCYECHLTWPEEGAQQLHFQLRKGASLRWQEGVLTLELGSCGMGRTTRKASCPTLKELTIFSDTSSVEIFVNGGAFTMSTRLFSCQKPQPVWISQDTTLGQVEAYQMGELEFDWMNEVLP